MSTPTTTLASNLGPINPDWTIAELVEWLSDDSRQHDPALQHPLAVIEAAMTGEQWSRTPSTVALIRSIAAAVRVSGRPGLRIAQLVRKAEVSEPFARFESAREPQVA
jgi:hypothetical protein